MTNEELVIRIQAGEDKDGSLMLQLWQQVKAFIHLAALRYKGYAELEDLDQEGYMALYDAIDGYNPAAGCLFLTYAGKWINQRMRRYIQNNGTVRIPVHEQEKIQDYKKLVQRFEQQAGRKPTDREASRRLGLSMEQISNLKRAREVERIGSLDSPVAGLDGGEDITLGELVADALELECSVLDKLQQEQLRTVIWPLVDALPKGQGEVIRMRYREGMTLQQAGAVMGCGHQRAYELHRKGLRELRKPGKANQLRPFLDEYIYSRATRGSGVETFNRTWTSSTERVALELAGLQ